MKKIVIFFIVCFLIFPSMLLAKDDSKPRELTSKERREICREMSKSVKQSQKIRDTGAHGFHNIRKGEIKCLGRDARNILIRMEGMNEYEAMNFFDRKPELKEDFKIAGYRNIYFEDLNGNRWILSLE
ncbi:MAG: hypothetical protein ABFD07_10935 [Methanobacterium sp.]